MSTEMTWLDMMPSLKMSGRLTMGLVKGAVYLGKKALSSSGGNQRIDVIPPFMKAIDRAVELFSASRMKNIS